MFKGLSIELLIGLDVGKRIPSVADVSHRNICFFIVPVDLALSVTPEAPIWGKALQLQNSAKAAKVCQNTIRHSGQRDCITNATRKLDDACKSTELRHTPHKTGVPSSHRRMHAREEPRHAPHNRQAGKDACNGRARPRHTPHRKLG